MEEIIFDTNAYYLLVGLFHDEQKARGISMAEFCREIIEAERKKSCTHALHQLVLQEIIRQYKFSKLPSLDMIKLIGCMLTVSEDIQKILPFEVEYAMAFPEDCRKSDYITLNAKAMCFITNSLKDTYLHNNTLPKTEKTIECISQATETLKKVTADFFQQRREEARSLNIEDIQEQLVNEFIDCIRFSLADDIVNNFDKGLNKPYIKYLLDFSQKLHAWIHDPSINFEDKSHQVPNSFIDAFILASACMNFENATRILVTEDTLVHKQKSLIDSSTTKILHFSEYLNYIGYNRTEITE